MSTNEHPTTCRFACCRGASDPALADEEPLDCNDPANHEPHVYDAAAGYPGPSAWFRCLGRSTP